MFLKKLFKQSNVIMQMPNYTKSAIKGTTTILVVSLIAAFMGYVVRAYMARNLSLEEFGLFYAVFSFLGLFGFFKGLGIDRALIKFIPEFQYKKDYSAIKNSIMYAALVQLATNSLVIAGIYIFSGYLSGHFFHHPSAGWLLKLMAVAFFIDNFVFILKFIFQGFQKMLLFSGIDLVRMAIILAVIAIGFREGYGLISPVVAYILTPAILLAIYFPILARRVFPNFLRIKTVASKPLGKYLLSYGMFVLADDFGWLALGYADSIMLTYFTGLVSVGLYNAAMPTSKLLVYLPRAIAGVLLPMSSELWIKNEKGILKNGMELLYKYTILIVLPLALAMFSFSGTILRVFFGGEYAVAGDAMKILSIGMVFGSIYGINASFFSGIGKPQVNSGIVYSAAAFNIIANFIFIPWIGMAGAALTTSLSYFLMMIIGLKCTKKYIGAKLPLKLWLKILCAGSVFVASIWIIKKMLSTNIWVESAVSLFAAGTVYVGIMFALKIVNAGELKEICKKVLG